MNGFLNKFKNPRTRNKSVLSLAISIVILIEVIGIAFFAVQAWVETVSSIKITNETNTKGTVGTYVFTDATIGSASGTIDIADYFKQSGDMHLAPASSADGTTFFFPKVYNYNSQNPTYVYRKGNSSDKNTAYLSVTFRLKADTNADFFFTKTPAITVENDIRVSVTAYTEGTSSGDLYDAQTGLPKYTKIYANNASTTPVVNSTTGATGATTVEKFTDHEKGKSSTARLFAVGANETKIVTINVWWQKSTNNNNDLTANKSVSTTISNLGIISSLTPRHVTLLPTPTWDVSGTTQYFYAWCWGATNGDASKLYKLELDDNEHYSFDYNGTYQSTLFFRSGNGNLTTDMMNANNDAAWSNGTIWNKTEDTSIPNDPIDPTFIIETINGSSEIDTSSGNNSTAKKSTGSWHDPVTVHVDYVTGQTDTWGTIAATSYVGTTTSTHVIEATNSDSQKHKDTVHAWPGKKLKLVATPKTNYAFVGWYSTDEGTGTALSTDTTYEPSAPSNAGGEITYYAKFKETRTLTIYRYLDGNSSSAACGTITVNGSSSTSGTSKSATVDKGTSVEFSASAATGYTLNGIYTTATGSTIANSSLTLNSNTTYYARFTTNYYLKASWNSWSETQDQLTGTGNELTFVQELDPGQYQFKIFGGGSHWSNAYEYKYNYNGSTYFGASGDDTLNSSNTTGYMKLNTGTTAKYTFHFNKSTKEFWITSNVDCHVVGDITGGWSTGDNNKMTRVGSTNEYTFTVKVNGSKSFKILTSSGTWYGNGHRYHDDYYGASGGDTFNTPGTNCTMDGSNKDYVFHFDISTQKFWITDP